MCIILLITVFPTSIFAAARPFEHYVPNWTRQFLQHIPRQDKDKYAFISGCIVGHVFTTQMYDNICPMKHEAPKKD